MDFYLIFPIINENLIKKIKNKKVFDVYFLLRPQVQFSLLGTHKKVETMAALRRLSKNIMLSSHLPKTNSSILSSSALVPALVISTRGIASKLFVGGRYLRTATILEQFQISFFSC